VSPRNFCRAGSPSFFGMQAYRMVLIIRPFRFVATVRLGGCLSYHNTPAQEAEVVYQEYLLKYDEAPYLPREFITLLLCFSFSRRQIPFNQSACCPSYLRHHISWNISHLGFNRGFCLRTSPLLASHQVPKLRHSLTQPFQRMLVRW